MHVLVTFFHGIWKRMRNIFSFNFYGFSFPLSYPQLIFKNNKWNLNIQKSFILLCNFTYDWVAKRHLNWKKLIPYNENLSFMSGILFSRKGIQFILWKYFSGVSAVTFACYVCIDIIWGILSISNSEASSRISEQIQLKTNAALRLMSSKTVNVS